jgi:hypothetical protein
LSSEYDWYMGPLGLGYGTYDSDMIDLSAVISSLPLVIKIGVGTSGDYKDFAMSGEGFNLLWRLSNL